MTHETMRYLTEALQIILARFVNNMPLIQQRYFSDICVVTIQFKLLSVYSNVEN